MTAPASPDLQQHQLALTARPRPETLERILRVVRHRGFTLCAIEMHSASDNLNIALTVASPRSIALLLNQLGKLADVIGVELTQRLAPSQPVISQPFQQVRA